MPSQRWKIIYLCAYMRVRTNQWVCVCSAIGLKLTRIRRKFSMNARIIINRFHWTHTKRRLYAEMYNSLPEWETHKHFGHKMRIMNMEKTKSTSKSKQAPNSGREKKNSRRIMQIGQIVGSRCTESSRDCQWLNGKWRCVSRRTHFACLFVPVRNNNIKPKSIYSLNRYTVEYFSSDLQTGWVVAMHRYPGHMVTVSSINDAARKQIN